MFKRLQEENPRWMFMSVVGSQNYGTAVESSDTDIKVVYLPTFEEFYRNKFQHMDTGSPEGDDYTLHPAHEFLRHAFKGNMNFWEVFFADSLEINWKFWNESGEMRMFFSHCRDIVTMNSHNNFNAMRGMAHQKYVEAMKRMGASNPLADDKWYSDQIAGGWKAAQHSMRMLDTILEYHRTGCLELNLTALPNAYPIWADWREPSGVPGDIRFVEYVEFYNETLQMVDDLESNFISHHNATDIRSNRERYMATVDQIMMKLILENS